MSSFSRVIFVCLHGSAKSVIAAAWLNFLASERGLPIGAKNCGTEPDMELPPYVITGMSGEGLPTMGIIPQAITSLALGGAARVVTFGPDVSGYIEEDCPVETWKVPNVDAGYAAASMAIRAKVEELVQRLVNETR